jgi:integrase
LRIRCGALPASTANSLSSAWMSARPSWRSTWRKDDGRRRRAGGPLFTITPTPSRRSTTPRLQRGRLLVRCDAIDPAGVSASEAFRGCAERTRADYVKKTNVIEKKFADFALAALTDRRSRGLFMAWRDELALRSRRQADDAWTVLARLLSWLKIAGLWQRIRALEVAGLYRGSRADRVWTADDEANFLAKAPAHLHLPLMLAIWTGQRQGDLLRLTWKSYDGKHIRLRQSRTGARVVIPVGAPLLARRRSSAPQRPPPMPDWSAPERSTAPNTFGLSRPNNARYCALNRR